MNRTTCGNITSDVIVNDTSDVTCAEHEGSVNRFAMPWLPWSLWTTAFSLMLTIAIGGNSIVCWIILGEL